MQYKNHSGFLLMELLIAVAILVAVSGVVAYYFNAISLWNREVGMRLRAINEVSCLYERCAQAKKIIESAAPLPSGMVVHAQEISVPLIPDTPLLIGQDKDSPIPFTLLKIQATWKSGQGEEKKYAIVSGFVR
jgi:Tfp pilus assembly protein PilW